MLKKSRIFNPQGKEREKKVDFDKELEDMSLEEIGNLGELRVGKDLYNSTANIRNESIYQAVKPG